ncbi:MAG: MOSC domain-containing protein [Acidobacteriota bacterium]|nr:MOSC domain-containing protein [Acidobacteriota bacterium]
MKLLSINVGRPRLVMSKNGDPVSTAIFKEPISGRVMLRTLNLDGDRQADLSVHGGPSKAVYLYPSEHYAYWQSELPEMSLPYGMFGENFTTEDLLEEEINIGDCLRVGDAELMVTEPRMPCYKLGLKFGRADIIKKFMVSNRPGFYCAVLREGEVGIGDSFELISRDPAGVTVTDIVSLYVRDKRNLALLRRAVEVEALPQGWRDHFRQQLERLNAG